MGNSQRKERKSIQVRNKEVKKTEKKRNKEVKLSLFVNDMAAYVEESLKIFKTAVRTNILT